LLGILQGFFFAGWFGKAYYFGLKFVITLRVKKALVQVILIQLFILFLVEQLD